MMPNRRQLGTPGMTYWTRRFAFAEPDVLNALGIAPRFTFGARRALRVAMTKLFAKLTPMSQHVSYETLGLYVLGDLSVRAALAAEEHLAWCSQCNDALPNVKAVIAALRA
jgi:hypothetical protein